MSFDDSTDSNAAGRNTVLVTGAAGGLGAHLVDVLAQGGWRVRALDVVDAPDSPRRCLLEATEPVEWVKFHNADSELREALRGCQAVVHAAGIASLSAPEADLFAANRDLTRRLFLISCDSGVDHFVHISCASVYRADTEVRTEQSPTEAYNAFERSKLAAETTLRTLAETRDQAPAVTILRPGLLYGPGCITMGSGMVTLPAILRGFSRYLPGLSGGPRTNWCHARDAAEAVRVVLDNDQARGEILNVADDTALSFGEVLTSIIEGYNIDLGPSVRIPSVALWALLSPVLDNDWAFDKARSLLKSLWRGVQRKYELDSPLTPRLDRDALFYVRDDAILVADRLRSLGWRPQWPDYREGIADTIRWYQNQGWAPRYDREAVIDRPPPDRTSHFDYDETLRGSFDDDVGRHPMRLQFQVSWPSIPWPPSGGEGLLQGRVTIPGVAADTPVRGTVQLSWFPVFRMDYQFGFRNDDDRACRFVGRRRFRFDAPRESLARLEGTFINRFGEPIGEATAHPTGGPLALLGTGSEPDTTAPP